VPGDRPVSTIGRPPFPRPKYRNEISYPLGDIIEPPREDGPLEDRLQTLCVMALCAQQATEGPQLDSAAIPPTHGAAMIQLSLGCAWV
jgi:hypothetical protein